VAGATGWLAGVGLCLFMMGALLGVSCGKRPKLGFDAVVNRPGFATGGPSVMDRKTAVEAAPVPRSLKSDSKGKVRQALLQ
jgi:hypothetical protein